MSGGGAYKKGSEVLTRDFIKKYISYSKTQANPELTDDVLQYVSECYCFLRQHA
jgi:DNA replicative helicase MCM subunit Mcm2 (Cdc46/Mcm family)